MYERLAQVSLTVHCTILYLSYIIYHCEIKVNLISTIFPQITCVP